VLDKNERSLRALVNSMHGGPGTSTKERTRPDPWGNSGTGTAEKPGNLHRSKSSKVNVIID